MLAVERIGSSFNRPNIKNNNVIYLWCAILYSIYMYNSARLYLINNCVTLRSHGKYYLSNFSFVMQVLNEVCLPEGWVG